MKLKVCNNCGRKKKTSQFHSAGIKGKGYTRNICKTCRGDIRRERRLSDPEYHAREKKLRSEQYARMSQRDFELAIRHYGGKCKKCEENRLMALLLHHINRGKGSKKFDQGRKQNPWFYSQLRKWGYPEGLEVLCGTCHLIHHRKELRKL